MNSSTTKYNLYSDPILSGSTKHSKHALRKNMHSHILCQSHAYMYKKTQDRCMHVNATSKLEEYTHDYLCNSKNPNCYLSIYFSW